MEIRATTAEMLSRIGVGWEHLQSYLASLSDEQLSVPTDAAGWTVKDHLMHIAVWEDGIEALLQKQERHKRMGLPDGVWGNSHVDEINAMIQQAHKDKSAAEIRRLSNETHQKLISTIGAMTDDELNLPYKHYAPDADREEPVFGWIVGNTYEHYEEHLPWMQAISDQK